jgi:hypothetical protein
LPVQAVMASNAAKANAENTRLVGMVFLFPRATALWGEPSMPGQRRPIAGCSGRPVAKL